MCPSCFAFFVQNYRAAAWIGYYRLLPEIIGYFPYSLNFRVAKMNGNNGMFYGGTKI